MQCAVVGGARESCCVCALSCYNSDICKNFVIEASMSYLSQDQIEFYHDNGYLVISRFWDEATVEQLLSRMNKLVSSADLTNVKSIFSTKEQTRKSDDYFLNSGYAIRYFWEEKAWDKDGNFLADDATLAINKVGHALHDMEPDFQQVSYEDRIGSICEELGLQKPLIAQSMYIFKQPQIGTVLLYIV
jgi:phytanoyl-CoA hydroxylase